MHKKMLNITNHYRSENYKHNKVLPHNGDGNKVTSVVEDVEKLQPLYSQGECKTRQPLRKTGRWVFPQKLEIELTYETAISSGYILKKNLK